eukprot:TRINITY_DN12077_c0_g4_i1.p1 TRINITY_DN12077_c0_g4~~TRINITY_DN12077_c0_g4_i1.p1  ORF type:complete len:593 (-),score=97.67 TRINITY_DN12077_c0_g4_i1:89-1714(-)
MFGLLTTGITFDRSKFSEDIQLFKNPDSQSYGEAQKQSKKIQDELIDTDDSENQEELKDQEFDDVIKVFQGSKKRQNKVLFQHENFKNKKRQKAGGEDSLKWRKIHKIYVQGQQVPIPLRTFDDLSEKFKVDQKLLDNLKTFQYDDPTSIQMQVLPCLFGQRDLLATAPTGSGKTLSFLLPMLSQILKDKRSAGQHILQGIIVSPTIELSAQTQRVVNWMAENTGVNTVLLNKTNMAEVHQADIILGSPLKLARFIHNNKLDCSKVKFLVLDEADKLFSEEIYKRRQRNKKLQKGLREKQFQAILDSDDEDDEEVGEADEQEENSKKVGGPLKAGSEFYKQILGILQKCRENQDVVVALFSATLPEMVELAAREFLIDPIRVSVGKRNAAASTVSQSLRFVGNDSGKLLALKQILQDGGLKPPILVFVETKERTQLLYEKLKYNDFRIDCIHSDHNQATRETAVDKFRAGQTWVLIATELLGRGMDFIGINTVINYDFPKSTMEYVHRVGRTGRAGKQGESVTFFTYDNLQELRPIANVMK